MAALTISAGNDILETSIRYEEIISPTISRIIPVCGRMILLVSGNGDIEKNLYCAVEYCSALESNTSSRKQQCRVFVAVSQPDGPSMWNGLSQQLREPCRLIVQNFFAGFSI